MLPEEFIKRLDSQKYIDRPSLIRSLHEASPVSIRINPEKWHKVPAASEPVSWCKEGWYLAARPSFTLDPLFHSGCYYPQEASSMFIGHIFRQLEITREGIRALDLCGAPGGKSTHLSELIGSGGMLVANEVIRSRSLVLAETLTKWGASNALVTQNDPSAFTGLRDYFDLILVDAPCSGEGMFRTEVARNEWSPANAAHCSERQRRIVMDAWPALKKGGYMVYSTCTFNPAENEENIEWLKEHTDSDSVRIDLAGTKGITEIQTSGSTGYGFYPGKINGEGFFVSVLRKGGSAEAAFSRGKKKSSSGLSGSEISRLTASAVCSEEALWRSGDSIHVLPCLRGEFEELGGFLRIVKAGTRIFNVKGGDFLPSHELALSGLIRKGVFPVTGVNLGEALSYMKRDSLAFSIEGKGWNLLSYKDVPIGFVNNLGNRLNNYFPVDWRIRMDIPARKDLNIIGWNGEEA